MKSAGLIACVLWIALPASAQSFITSPAGFERRESPISSSVFGVFPEARYMFCNGEMRNRAGALKGVQFRAHYRNHNSHPRYRDGFARTWRNVTLRVATCDHTKITKTFSQNPTSTPTLVFSASVSWPRLQGLPPRLPPAWGGGGAYAMPFTTTWQLPNNADLCLDFEFRRGQVGNNLPSLPYYLAGYPTGQALQSQSTQHGQHGTTGGCRDPMFSVAASTTLQIRAYGPLYGFPWYRNKTEACFVTRNTAGGRPVVHVLGTVGHPAGFPGVACNKVYLDLRAPVVVSLRRADNTGLAGTCFRPFTVASSIRGTPVWAQAAWNHSQNQSLLVTPAARSTLQQAAGAVPMSEIYQQDLTKRTVGHGPFRSFVNVLMRFDQ